MLHDYALQLQFGREFAIVFPLVLDAVAANGAMEPGRRRGGTRAAPDMRVREPPSFVSRFVLHSLYGYAHCSHR